METHPYAVMHDQLCMMRALFDTSFTTTAVALLLDLATAPHALPAVLCSCVVLTHSGTQHAKLDEESIIRSLVWPDPVQQIPTL